MVDSKARLIPTEAQSQAALIQWARLPSTLSRYPELALLHHIPNGGHRHPAVAAKLKAQGVLAGIPDLFLPVARLNQHGLYIEMKRKGETLSKAQDEIARLLIQQGYGYYLAYTWEEAKEVIEAYLK